MGMKKNFGIKKLIKYNAILNFLVIAIIFIIFHISNKEIEFLENVKSMVESVDNCFKKADYLKYKITDDYLTNPSGFQTLKITNFKNEIGKIKFDLILLYQKINKTKIFSKRQDILKNLDSLKILLNNQLNILNNYILLLEKRGSELTNGIVSNISIEGEKILKENDNKLLYQLRIMEAKAIYGGLPLDLQKINEFFKQLDFNNNDIVNSYINNLKELDIINRQLGWGMNDENSMLNNYIKNQKTANKLLIILKNDSFEYINKKVKLGIYLTLLLIFLVIISYYFAYNLINKRLLIYPINIILKNINNLKEGEYEIDTNKRLLVSEFNIISDNISKIAEYQKNRLEFIKALNSNNFDIDLIESSEKDSLQKELKNLKDILKISYEEKIKHDEENRLKRYINEGIAKFSEIAHTNYGKLAKLTDEYIKELTKYLNVIQGGIYLIDDNDKNILNLISAFAYDRKKFLNKTYKIGEGLVGTCALEKKILIVDNVPESYIKITSGLGDTPPRHLYILPMLHNDDLIGVIELASLDNLEDYKIDFAQQSANILAISIANEKINERTRKLLEQTQEQALKMKEQEEEMRQNLEELQASQEEFSRREENLKGILNALNQSWLVAELDNNCCFTSMNLNFLVILGKTLEDVIGKKYYDVINGTNSKMVNENLIAEVLQGKQLEHEEILYFGKKQSKLILKFSPIYNNLELPIRVLCSGYEVKLF